MAARAAFFYVNGMMNDEDSARTAALQIEEVVGCSVHLHHNSVTSWARAACDGALFAAGMLFGLYSTKKEKEKKGTAASRASGVLGTICAGVAAADVVSMQQEKEALASSLRTRLEIFLEENPTTHLNLILHSQGADVGNRVLIGMSPAHLLRVRVVTLGGESTVPAGLCLSVVNFKFNTDYVSRILALPFEVRQWIIDGREHVIHSLSSEMWTNVHGLSDYLNHFEVQNWLRGLANHTLHFTSPSAVSRPPSLGQGLYEPRSSVQVLRAPSLPVTGFDPGAPRLSAGKRPRPAVDLGEYAFDLLEGPDGTQSAPRGKKRQGPGRNVEPGHGKASKRAEC